MPLTRDFKRAVVERMQREPVSAQAQLNEAASLFLNGDPATARLILRDLVNAGRLAHGPRCYHSNTGICGGKP